MRKPLGADLVIPALALGFAAYFFVSIADLAWEAKANGMVIGGILVVLIAIQLVRIAIRVVQGQGKPRLERPVGAARSARQARRHGARHHRVHRHPELAGLTLGLLLALFAALWIMGRAASRWRSFRWSVAAAAYLLFVYLLQSDIPHGPIERLFS